MGENESASPEPLRDARAKGDDVARSRQLELLGRAGLVARGVIYVLIGVLAIMLAVGEGGKTTNQQGALKTAAQRPFGEALLVILTVGLAGYAIWRLVRAAIGHGPEESVDTKERIANSTASDVRRTRDHRLVGARTRPDDDALPPRRS